ncbi:hypothetical protein HMPREF1980_01634, partial [Actinomyces sp. oral taxon 172 str. F0311]
APFGARCFLTHHRGAAGRARHHGLNAPFGARCFLTRVYIVSMIAAQAS